MNYSKWFWQESYSTLYVYTPSLTFPHFVEGNSKGPEDMHNLDGNNCS